MNELALFAGAGGGILGGSLLGWRTVCAVEIEAYPREVLLRRQRDGLLPLFPIWDDVKTFDGRSWRGKVDIITGGFPCQDISAAGRGEGITGERSGLWGEMARIIGEVGPRYALMENSPMLTSRGLGTVLGDLAEIGYDAVWDCIPASAVGAPHRRDRIWILAYSNDDRRHAQGDNKKGAEGEAFNPTFPPGKRREDSPGSEDVANTDSGHGHGGGGPLQMGWCRVAGETQEDGYTAGAQWSVEPALGRVAHGVAYRVDRLAGIGNGQVPAVVVRAWETLSVLI